MLNETIFFQNRNGQRMAVTVEESPNTQGLAFIMHGLGGFKEQPHIQTIARAFQNNGFTVIRFDTTSSAALNFYQDLEDIIEWAGTQNFYKEPFWLAGHSLGGIAAALYAQQHPEKVVALAPLSTVVAGKLVAQNRRQDLAPYDLVPKAGKLVMPVLLVVGSEDSVTPLAHQEILYRILPGKKELRTISGAPHTFSEERHLRELATILENWIKSILK
jgi:pimeloyl-ACP methyl ester carboxylesterase